MRGVVRAAFVALFSLSASLFALAGGQCRAERAGRPGPGRAAAHRRPPRRHRPRASSSRPTPTIPASTSRPLKGVTLDGCKAACTDNQSCRAFTFNAKAGWCFLKIRLRRARPRRPAPPPAASWQTAELTPSLEKQRLGELDFPLQHASSTRRASSPARSSAAIRPATARYQALRDAGGAAYRAGSYDSRRSISSARRSPSPTTIPASGSTSPSPTSRCNPDELLRQAGSRDQHHRGGDRRLSPLRRRCQPGARRSALMGERLRAARDVEAGLPRLSRQPRDRRGCRRPRRTTRRCIAEHGFRIVSNTVDADSAEPRICIVFSDKLAVDAARPRRLRHRRGRRQASRSSRATPRSASTASSTAAATRCACAAACRPPTARRSPSRPSSTSMCATARPGSASPAMPTCCRPAGASIPIVSVNTDKAKATIYRIGDRGLAGDDPRRRNFLPPARPLQRRHDQRQDRREGLGRRDRHPADAQRERHHRDPGRRRGQGPEAGRLRHHRQGGGRADSTTTTITARSRRSGSSSPTSASPRSPAMTACTPSCARCRPPSRSPASSSGWSRSTTRSSAKRSTDADGYARFDPGLARGTGGMAPQLVDARDRRRRLRLPRPLAARPSTCPIAASTAARRRSRSTCS